MTLRIIKGCPACHGLPSVVDSGHIICNNHQPDFKVSAYGDTLEQTIENWNNNDWVELGALLDSISLRPNFEVDISRKMEGFAFGKAVDLVKAVQAQIAIHGDDLRVAFFLDDDDAKNIKGATGGSIQVDNVELANTPLLCLMWEYPHHVNNEEFREFLDAQFLDSGNE